MNSIDNALMQDETIIYRTRCHYAILCGPILLMFIAALAAKSQGLHAVTLMAFGVIWSVFSYISFRRSEIGVTPTRVLINAGFPLVRFSDIPLTKIVAIDFFQPALGAILGFGKLVIVHDGQSKCIIRFVAAPAEFVTRVRRQMTTPP